MARLLHDADAMTSNNQNPKYIRPARVRALAKTRGRRVSKEFLSLLDACVRDKVERACVAHNGSKITLDSAMAVYVGAVPKP